MSLAIIIAAVTVVYAALSAVVCMAVNRSRPSGAPALLRAAVAALLAVVITARSARPGGPQ